MVRVRKLLCENCGMGKFSLAEVFSLVRQDFGEDSQSTQRRTNSLSHCWTLLGAYSASFKIHLDMTINIVPINLDTFRFGRVGEGGFGNIQCLELSDT
jgi:hypothetical protein